MTPNPVNAFAVATFRSEASVNTRYRPRLCQENHQGRR